MVYIPLKALRYCSHIPSHVKTSEFPLTKLDAKKLEGFQSEIPVFEGVKMEDIAFLSKNLRTINLFRGCKWGCPHCPTDAMAPVKDRESVLFEDFKRLVLGFKSLNHRLGFNVLEGTKHINIVEDSNPFDFPIKGLSKKHTILEAMKYLYLHLGIPMRIVTSGLKMAKSKDYLCFTMNAKGIVKMAKRDKNSVDEVQIAINPFMDSKDYTDRMAATLYLFLDLFKLDKARILYKHAKDGQTDFDEKATKLIYEQIYRKLQKLADSKLEGFPELKPEVVTKFDESHLIEPSGRGRKFLTMQQNKNIQEQLAQESLEWQNLSEEEQREILLNKQKGIDIDGSVYTIKQSNVPFIQKPIETVVPTNIQLNYENKKRPNPLFCDMNH